MKKSSYFVLLFSIFFSAYQVNSQSYKIIDSVYCKGTTFYYLSSDSEGFYICDYLIPSSLVNAHILAKYKTYATPDFLKRFKEGINIASSLIDSLNKKFPEYSPVQSVYIMKEYKWRDAAMHCDHKIFLSTGDFFLGDTLTFDRLLYTIAHEYGHSLFQDLDELSSVNFLFIWNDCDTTGTNHIFEDSFYHHDWGGHPEDDPTELFASAFNILNFHEEEFKKWSKVSSLTVNQKRALIRVINFFMARNFVNPERYHLIEKLFLK